MTTKASVGNPLPGTKKPISPGDLYNPDTANYTAPKLQYWTKKSGILGDDEAILKNLLVDTMSNCAGTPSQYQNNTISQAQTHCMGQLEQDNNNINQMAGKYGIQQTALRADSRLRLREDGELEIFSVSQPHQQPMKVQSPTTASRPDDVDYPANAELKELITSDIWRNLTRAEKESAVAAINEALMKRRQDMEIMARLESSNSAGSESANQCFCQKQG